MFIENMIQNPQYYVWVVLIVVLSVCFHEMAHAVVASQQGDDTARDEGHITMNPMKQMGPVSLGFLFLCGISWGAVPVNPYNYKHKHSDALISFAGPAANFALMMGFIVLGWSFVPMMGASDSVVWTNLSEFFWLGAKINAGLFLFNMLPVPPLDGYKIAQHFFPGLRPMYANMGYAGMALVLVISFVPLAGQAFWGTARSLAYGTAMGMGTLLGFG